MAKYLEDDILNVGFGVLNPLSDKLSGKYFDFHSTTSLDAIKNATKDFYSESILSNAGRFIGIVLRVDGLSKNGYSDINSWASVSNLMLRGASKNESPSLLQIRVRIPEFHGHLPVPKTLPDFSEDSEDHNIINLYPSFVAESESLSLASPEPGTLVWVDFQDRSTQTGPIYYGMVADAGTSFPTRGKIEDSASEYFDGGTSQVSNSNLQNVQVVDYSSALTTVTLSAAQPIAPPGFKFTRSKLKLLRQNRVRRFAYGNCKREGPPMVPLPGPKNPKGHPFLATRLEAMNQLWRRYVQKKGIIGQKVPKGKGNGVEEITPTLEVSNGFRDKKSYPLNNEGFQKWGREVIEYYKKRDRDYTCRQASVLRAFASPHETGLAVDFSNNGLASTSKTMSTQVKSPAFLFLVKYAWLFGFYPYNGETWHWEVQVPREAWRSGEEFAGNPKYGDLEPLRIVSNGGQTLVAGGSGPGFENFDTQKANIFSGPDYDWLEGEIFPYAIWVDEKVKSTGIKTADGQFAGLRTWKPGAETFRLPRGIQV